VLEGAVGIGAYADLWKVLGVERWVGLDLSGDSVERLRGRFPEHVFFQFDLTNGESRLEETLHGEHFDLVTAVDVLYHLMDEWRFEEALTALASRVRPGGFLLLSDVFVPQPVRVAGHVLRRPMARYTGLLAGHGFQLVDREPVFAILGDPVPREGHYWADFALRTSWRMLSKAIRTAPGELRERVGRALARALVPLDDVLKRSGRLQGSNLELALFHRA
jgi:SAM-dependent methyltransferase